MGERHLWANQQKARNIQAKLVACGLTVNYVKFNVANNRYDTFCVSIKSYNPGLDIDTIKNCGLSGKSEEFEAAGITAIYPRVLIRAYGKDGRRNFTFHVMIRRE